MFADNSFDSVIHFAALKAVGESVAKPVVADCEATVEVGRVRREHISGQHISAKLHIDVVRFSARRIEPRILRHRVGLGTRRRNVVIDIGVVRNAAPPVIRIATHASRASGIENVVIERRFPWSTTPYDNLRAQAVIKIMGVVVLLQSSFHRANKLGTVYLF